MRYFNVFGRRQDPDGIEYLLPAVRVRGKNVEPYFVRAGAGISSA